MGEWLAQHDYIPMPGLSIVRVDPDYIRMQFFEFGMFSVLYADNAELAGDFTQREAGAIAEIAQSVGFFNRQSVFIDGSLKDAAWYKPQIKYMRDQIGHYKVGIIYIEAPFRVIQAAVASRAEKTGRTVPFHVWSDSWNKMPSSIEVLSGVADYVAIIANDGKTLPKVVMQITPQQDFAVWKTHFEEYSVKVMEWLRFCSVWGDGQNDAMMTAWELESPRHGMGMKCDLQSKESNSLHCNNLGFMASQWEKSKVLQIEDRPKVLQIEDREGPGHPDPVGVDDS